jgi:hypothetical protein
MHFRGPRNLGVQQVGLGVESGRDSPYWFVV